MVDAPGVNQTSEESGNVGGFVTDKDARRGWLSLAH